MDFSLKIFLLRLVTLILLTPLLGWVFLRYAEYVSKAWQTKSKLKKWWLVSVMFFMFAIFTGWLR